MVILIFEVPELIDDPSSSGQWLYVLAGLLVVALSVADEVRVAARRSDRARKELQ